MAGVKTVVKDVKSTLQSLCGQRYAKLVLYGSYARNSQHVDSDIDLLLLLKDNDVRLGAELRFMGNALYEVALRHNMSISVMPATQNWLESSGSLLAQNIRNEGLFI